jgi:murein DD-endopeptidase MepM/ murein hydrolase activator NlpD
MDFPHSHLTIPGSLVKMGVLILAAACLSQASVTRRCGRHTALRPPSVNFKPTPEIDAHVAYEVAKAKQILENLNTDNLLADPYVVSAIYYHDGFLRDFPVNQSDADPERQIIDQIGRLLSTESKARFLRLLEERWGRSNPVSGAPPVAPVVYSALGGGRHSHRYAIDLFVAEGSAVHSVTRGLVVLADRDWTPDDVFSTTSRKGGNSVIVFAADQERFYRYCHMATVEVTAGEPVAAGQIIGKVGHSGLNAAAPGHGRHLHFEVNEYHAGRVQALDYLRLRAMLRQLPPPAERRGG